MITKHNRLLGMKLIDLSDNTQVNSGGGTNTQTLQPPQGLMYKVVDMYYSAIDPVGSSANNHRLYVNWSGRSDYGPIFISANTGANIKIQYNGFDGTAEVPANIGDQYKVMREWLHCTYDLPIEFKYENNTDANQTGTRTLEIIVEVYAEEGY